MSLRQMFQGSIVKPGFNPLATQTPTYTYFPYLYSWGVNSYGQLGLGNTTAYSSPKQVGSLTNWSQVAGGKNFNVSVKNDGTLWSWGQNATYGQLGLGDTSDRNSPVQVGALTNWLNVACGLYHAIATKTDGTIWSWGRNSNGQLGLVNTTNYSSPKQIGALTTWLKVACAAYSSFGIKTDGTLWSWGNNGGGVLGLGNTIYYSSPKQVGALTNWLQISSKQSFCLATKTDGTLWSWGRDAYGQLGLGNTTYYSSPKQIGALTTWSKASAGNNHSLAITTTGALWSWGYNLNGQLGLNNVTNYSSPKQVGSLTNWSVPAGGGYNWSAAVKTDGTMWSWGNNGNGQLGLNNATYYSSPKQIGALTTWLNVATNYYGGTALLY